MELWKFVLKMEFKKKKKKTVTQEVRPERQKGEPSLPSHHGCQEMKDLHWLTVH